MTVVIRPAKSPAQNARSRAINGGSPLERHAARTQAPIGNEPSTVISQKFRTRNVEKTPRTIIP